MVWLSLFAELRSCVKVEVVILGSLSLILSMVSVDVKQHFKKKSTVSFHNSDKDAPITETRAGVERTL